MHLRKSQRHRFNRYSQPPPSGLVTTLLALAGVAAVLAAAGAGAGAGFAGAGASAGLGGMYNGPLLPQPESAAKTRQAGSSKIDRRMMQSPRETIAV
jgi:hypothetical protein